MDEYQLTQEESKNNFIEHIILDVYQGTIESLTSLLRDGPPGRVPPKERILLHNKFLSLPSEDQDFIIKIIQETTRHCIFNFLVMMDNASGAPIEDKVSDYALYVQVYKDVTAEAENNFIEAIRVNPSYAPTEDLHDMFYYKLNKNSEENK